MKTNLSLRPTPCWSDCRPQRNRPLHLLLCGAVVAGLQATVLLNPARAALPGSVIGWGYWGGFETPPGLSNQVVAIDAAQYNSMALRSDGTVVSWGAEGSDYQEVDYVPPGLRDVTAISAGAALSLALKANGTVVAWGPNFSGQTNVPAGLNNVVGIAAGDYHGLALRADGTVVAWGQNDAGQANVPAGLPAVRAVAGGGHHSLALKRDGTVVGWGWNLYGQATPPAGLSNVIAIAAGDSHSVALRANGTVVAWGWNAYHQTEVPAGLSNVIAIAAGSSHSLALQRDGTVVAWGRNYAGELDVPPGLANVVSVAAGCDHSLVLVAPPDQQILVRAGSVWKYLDNGSNQGTAWRAPAFNDSAWSSGPAQLGYGDGDEATIINSGPVGSYYITTYFRQSFVLNEPPAFDQLTLRLQRDDGVVVYLNGVEIFRDNLPAGTISYTTPALTALSTAVENNFITATLPASGLVQGVNVLAVEVHQVNASSTDVSFDLELVGQLSAPVNPPVITLQPIPNATAVAGSGIMLFVNATGQSLQFQWQKDGVNLPGQTSATLALLSLQEAQAGSYRVIVSNAGGSVTSSACVLAVLPASVGAGCAGTLDPAFDAGSGFYPYWTPIAVTALAVQPDNKVLLAGGFEQVQGVEWASPARLNVDGSLDTSYIPNPADVPPHTRVVQADGKRIEIVPVEGAPPEVARFNADGSRDTTFGPALPAGFYARALALLPDGRLLVAGGVYRQDPQTSAQTVSQPVVRLWPNGALDATFVTNTVVGLCPGEWTAGEWVTVYDVLLQPDGRFYVGGFFTAVNGVRRTVVARFNPDGTLDASFEPDVEVHTGHDPGVVESVTAMAMAPDGKLYIAGFLERINGLSRNAIVRLHTQPDGCAGTIALAEPIYYTHENSGQVTVTLTRSRNTNTSAAVAYSTGSWATHWNTYSFSSYATDGEDYVPQAGVLTFAPGETSKQIAIPLINDALLESSEVFAVNLDYASGVPDAALLANLASSSIVMVWDDESVGLPGSVDETFLNSGWDGPVSALALLPDGTVLVGGSFTQAGGLARLGLARCAPNAYVTPTFAPVLDGSVGVIAVEPQSGKIVIAGDFTSVNGVPRPGLARLNPEGTLDAGFNPSVAGGVWELELMANGQMIIAGPFTTVSGQPRNGFARLNPDGSLDPAFNAGTGIGSWDTSHRVNDLLALTEGKLLVTGWFWTFNGTSCQAVVRLNANGTVDSTFNPTIFQAGDYGNSLALLPDGKVLLSGWIRYGLGGIYHVGLVRLLPDGSLDPSFYAKSRGDGGAIAVQADGKILLGGATRLNPDGTDDPTWFTGTGFGYGGTTALVVLPNGKVVVGGGFQEVNGFPYPFLAGLNGDPTAQLGAALDTVGLVWSTGSKPWFGQSTVTYDGVDAVQSGTNLTCDDHSWLKTTVTGPGTVSFRWKAQIEGAESSLAFYVAGGSGAPPEAAQLTETTDWQWVTCSFGPGEHELFWVVYGNCADYSRQMTAWLDEVVVSGPGPEMAPYFTTQPASQTVAAGATVTFQCAAAGYPFPTYQWQRNGVDLPGATNATLTISNVQSRHWGEYRVVANNPHGSATSDAASLQLWPLAGWGTQAYGVVTAMPAGLTDVVAVTAGAGHALAVRGDGTVTMWGYNAWGEVPADLSNVVAVAAGTGFSVALKRDGTVTAWSWSMDGETNVPPGLNDVVAIDCGGGHTIALRRDGTVVTWGYDPNNGCINVPPGLRDVVAVAAGGAHNLALKADGTVTAWGFNYFGQTDVPAGLKNVVAIATGYDFSLALDASGTVTAWGSDIYGQNAPPAGLTNVVAIAAGFDVGLALIADGTVVAWGNDAAGGVSGMPSGLSDVIGLAPGGEFEEEYNLVLRGNGQPVLLAQPLPRTALAGETVSFRALAVGRPPLSYQWFFNGQPIAGATSATLTIPTVEAGHAGDYSFTLSNALGTISSATAALTVTSAQGLAEALDATDLAWTTGGAAPWFGQADRTHDGVDAAQSGLIPDFAESWLETTVTLPTPGSVSFWWKVSCGAGDFGLAFYTNGAISGANLEGEVDWTLRTVALPAGTHVLRWTFRNAAAGDEGATAGWVDQVTISTGSGFVQRHIVRPTVQLTATPAAGVSVYAVEDMVPAGIPVNNISHGGVFDAANGKVKFGPFYDHEARLLSYDIAIPVGAHGVLTFTGNASCDGVSSPIGGDQQLVLGDFHPAELRDAAPADWRLTMDEVTAYASAWRRGLNWSIPPYVIPIDYVTRAAYLWQGGECYGIDPAVTNAPLWWVNCAPGQGVGAAPVAGLSGTVSVARQAAGGFVPGEPLGVTVSVSPPGEVRAYAVEDVVPPGWTAAAISNSGEFDAVNGKVKWGPFFDNTARALSYQLLPPPDATGPVSFVGNASFDGSSIRIAGAQQTQATGRLVLERNPATGGLTLRVQGAPQNYLIWVSTDLRQWIPLPPIVTPDRPLELYPSGLSSAPQRFYRAEPMPVEPPL